MVIKKNIDIKKHVKKRRKQVLKIYALDSLVNLRLLFHIRNLKFTEVPNYDYLRGLLK